MKYSPLGTAVVFHTQTRPSHDRLEGWIVMGELKFDEVEYSHDTVGVVVSLS
jgi:hypothetical protein